MSENSAIEWTDHTFNPWWGCTKVGPGCDHCYAEALARRIGANLWGVGIARRRVKDWSGPRRWQRHAKHYQELHGRRQRVFCASMADVFDNQVPDEWRLDLWQVIRETPDLDWIIVTKRIGNVPDMAPPDWPFHNVTLLITVVNQAEADRDIPKLLSTAASRRGISAEPLLGPIDFTKSLGLGNGPRLDWIIVGGESGTNARPMHPEWVRSIRDQCTSSGVAFFFKQWGEWAPGECCGAPPTRTERTARLWANEWIFESITAAAAREQHCDDEPDLYRIGKARAGRLLDGRVWDEHPFE